MKRGFPIQPLRRFPQRKSQSSWPVGFIPISGAGRLHRDYLGKDEHRLALLESLRTGGCEVRFAQDNCQHFAVIDETVLWYGSMNLLSWDDVEDNIMRLESREIAEELLGAL